MAELKLNHIEQLDIDDTGLLREVAVLKREEDGTIHYIPIETLHPLDKSRLKKIVTSQHADKYSLWELMSQAKLSNGMNALDFFHYNFVKVKRAPGSKAPGQGLADAQIINEKSSVTEGFTDPSKAMLDVR